MRQTSWPTPSYVLWLLSLYLAVAVAAASLFVIGALAISIPLVIPEGLAGFAAGVGGAVAIRHWCRTRRHLGHGFWLIPSTLVVIAAACLLISVPSVLVLLTVLAIKDIISITIAGIIGGFAVGMLVGDRGYYFFIYFISKFCDRLWHLLSHEPS